MDIKVAVSRPAKVKNACFVVALESGKKQNTTITDIDQQSGHAITKVQKRGDAKSTIGSTTLLHDVANSGAERLLLVGAGDNGEKSPSEFRKLCETSAKALLETTSELAVVHLAADITVSAKDTAWQCQQIAQAIVHASYQFTLHSTQKKTTQNQLKKCVVIVEKSELKACANALAQGHAVANGMNLCRDLGNLAPNICTPSYLASLAKKMSGKGSNITSKIVDEAQMKKLGMNAFLSVSRGSRQPGKLICMEYKGAAKSKKPIVLLGKGVTFDTGGISLKPSSGMDEMKYDMCGAASVFGAMKAISELQPSCNVIGVVAAAENMPDGDASRPGDVVQTMSGQSVEILNTDAEGRLVLCDSLTYIERYKPAAVVDVATLTGACVVALGHVCSAIMSNEQQLADELFEAGQTSGDLAWQLPLWDEYQSQLDSNFADIANIGSPPGAGAITAGCFLERFAKQYRWAHLDIAGIAWQKGANKGATGRPVPLLVQYVLDNQPA